MFSNPKKLLQQKIIVSFFSYSSKSNKEEWKATTLPFLIGARVLGLKRTLFDCMTACLKGRWARYKDLLLFLNKLCNHQLSYFFLPNSDISYSQFIPGTNNLPYFPRRYQPCQQYRMVIYPPSFRTYSLISFGISRKILT